MTAFMLAMPRQFARLTKMCPKDGYRLVEHDTNHTLVCPRCHDEY